MMTDFVDDMGFEPDSTSGSPDVASDNDPAESFVMDDSAEVGVVYGNPEAAADRWFAQEENGYCLPAAMTQVISEALDIDLTDESAVVEAMGELGIEFNPPHSGMTMSEGERVLEHFGVDTAHLEGLTTNDLARYLDDGHSVILAVDSNDYWQGVDSDDQADHAVVLTGIDTDKGVVILSDTGAAGDGSQYEVPLDVFDEAWAETGGQALVTTEPTLSPEELEQPAQAPSPGPILIPLVLDGGLFFGEASADGSLDVVATSYEVKPGDTLWDIAEAVYGDGGQWTTIAEANGITEGSIYEGQMLAIPQ